MRSNNAEHKRMRFGINARVASVFALLIVCLVGMCFLIYRDMRANLMDGRKVMLDNLVESASGILDYYYALEQSGTLDRAEAQRQAKEQIRKLRFDGNEYFWINDMQYKMLVHPFRPDMEGSDVSGLKDAEGFPIFVGFIKTVEEKGKGEVSYLWPKPGMDKPQPKMSYVQGFKPWNWVVGTGVYIDDLDAVLREQIRHVFIILGSILLLLLVYATPIIVSMVRAIRGITEAMRRVADGNLNNAVPYLDRSDEVGDMARALDVFRKNAQLVEQMQLENEEREAQAVAERKQEMARLADEFERAVSVVAKAVADTAGQMSIYARDLSAASLQTTEKSANVSRSSHEASANVSTVAAAAEELSSSIAEIMRQVTASTGAAENAVREAKDTNVTVTAMAEAVEKIGSVVQLINEIAEQTNLLALNATIEAARAGDAGKGFAVVASEVKNLATQTAKATEEITQQIEEIRSVAGSTVKAIRKIGSTIEGVSSIAAAIASAVTEQSSATSEISRNVQQASAGTREVSESIGDVSREAERSRSVAEQVSTAAQLLSQQSSNLQQKMSEFVAMVRSA